MIAIVASAALFAVLFVVYNRITSRRIAKMKKAHDDELFVTRTKWYGLGWRDGDANAKAEERYMEITKGLTEF